jgi:hypothetical protein
MIIHWLDDQPTRTSGWLYLHTGKDDISFRYSNQVMIIHSLDDPPTRSLWWLHFYTGKNDDAIHSSSEDNSFKYSVICSCPCS